MSQEENFFIRIIEYGIEHPNGFTYDEIINGAPLNLKDWEKEIIKKYFNNAYINSRRDESKDRSGPAETPFLLVDRRVGGDYANSLNKYVINFDSYFKYLDYQELKFARENAKTARNLSLYAIGIATFSIIVAILVPIIIKQTVKIEVKQFDQILSAIKNTAK